MPKRLDNFQPTHRVFSHNAAGRAIDPTDEASGFLRFEDLELEQALEASLFLGWNRLESPALAVFEDTLVVFHKKTWLFRGI